MNRLVIIACLCIAGLVCSGQSVPPLINYQGRLTDQTGAPLVAGSYGIQFRLWSSATGTSSNNLIWSRQLNVIVLSNGVFNAILGTSASTPILGDAPQVNDLSLAFADANRFLGITVASREGIALSGTGEILPRQQLLCAPYAVEARNASMLAQAAADLLAPPGTVVAWMGISTNPPAGWEFCWGQAVSRTDSKYARLYGVIGASNGQGDGATTFNLPDLRGMFLRGVNCTRTNEFADPDSLARTNSIVGGNSGNAVGSVQTDAFQGHQHGSIYQNAPEYPPQAGFGYISPNANGVATLSTAGYKRDQYEGNYGDPRRSSETRPKNIYVHYLIKL